MASQSERTYGQWLEQGRQIFSIISQLDMYAPSNNIIEKNTFSEFLELIEDANVQVAMLSVKLKASRVERYEMYKGRNGLKEMCEWTPLLGKGITHQSLKFRFYVYTCVTKYKLESCVTDTIITV